MHAVRNQPQGIIEMPREQESSISCGISDQDQTLAMTLKRLAQGNSGLSLAESAQEHGKLLSDDDPQYVSGMEIVFADSLHLELELATEMASLLEHLQKANLKRDQRSN